MNEVAVAGWSPQIALFVAPVLVFASYLVAKGLMDLLFTPMEIVAIAISAAVAALIVQNGESNWMEGVLLLAVCTIPGITFYFLPASKRRNQKAKGRHLFFFRKAAQLSEQPFDF